MTMLTAPTTPTLEVIQKQNRALEGAPAEEILRWAVGAFSPRIVALSSFGASSGALLHMLSRVNHLVPVVFLQTHYHFDETLRLRDRLADLYGLTVENWEVWGGRPAFLQHYPDDLNARPDLEGISIPEAAAGSELKTGVELCCWLNKVEPLQRALRNRLAYITSIRRDGGSEVRARTQIVEYYKPPGREEPLIKVNPLANWTKRDLWKYIHDNEVPVHELWPLGYKSIGCKPCTAPVGEGGDERDGRWSGSEKTECGIHTQHQPLNYEI